LVAVVAAGDPVEPVAVAEAGCLAVLAAAPASLSPDRVELVVGIAHEGVALLLGEKAVVRRPRRRGRTVGFGAQVEIEIGVRWASSDVNAGLEVALSAIGVEDDAVAERLARPPVALHARILASFNCRHARHGAALGRVDFLRAVAVPPAVGLLVLLPSHLHDYRRRRRWRRRDGGRCLG